MCPIRSGQDEHVDDAHSPESLVSGQHPSVAHAPSTSHPTRPWEAHTHPARNDHHTNNNASDHHHNSIQHTAQLHKHTTRTSPADAVQKAAHVIAALEDAGDSLAAGDGTYVWSSTIDGSGGSRAKGAVLDAPSLSGSRGDGLFSELSGIDSRAETPVVCVGCVLSG